MIQLRSVTTRYKNALALKNINLDSLFLLQVHQEQENQLL